MNKKRGSQPARYNLAHRNGIVTRPTKSDARTAPEQLSSNYSRVKQVDGMEARRTALPRRVTYLSVKH